MTADIKNGKGDADSLFVTEVSKPQPKDTEALIKVKAFGLNRMDLLQREGNYPVPPQAPKILGVEFSGTIESFGKTPESGFKIGDEVFGLAYGGISTRFQRAKESLLNPDYRSVRGVYRGVNAHAYP